MRMVERDRLVTKLNQERRGVLDKIADDIRPGVKILVTLLPTLDAMRDARLGPSAIDLVMSADATVAGRCDPPQTCLSCLAPWTEDRAPMTIVCVEFIGTAKYNHGADHGLLAALCFDCADDEALIQQGLERELGLRGRGTIVSQPGTA